MIIPFFISRFRELIERNLSSIRLKYLNQRGVSLGKYWRIMAEHT